MAGAWQLGDDENRVDEVNAGTGLRRAAQLKSSPRRLESWRSRRDWCGKGETTCNRDRKKGTAELRSITVFLAPDSLADISIGPLLSVCGDDYLLTGIKDLSLKVVRHSFFRFSFFELLTYMPYLPFLSTNIRAANDLKNTIKNCNEHERDKFEPLLLFRNLDKTTIASVAFSSIIPFLQHVSLDVACLTRNTLNTIRAMAYTCRFMMRKNVVTAFSRLLLIIAAQTSSSLSASNMRRGRPTTASLYLHDLTWSTAEGAILLNGRHQFHVKGANWFGLDYAGTRAPYGLWTSPLNDVLDFLALNQFNVLRLPVASTTANNLTLEIPTSSVRGDNSLRGMNVGQLLDTIFERAAARGILVVLALCNDDVTSLSGAHNEGLWYGTMLSYQEFQDTWRRLLRRYGQRWNLLGIDLLDRPGRGRAEWGVHNSSTDWNLAAQDTAAVLIQEYPQYRGLWFVQGIEGGDFAAKYATDLRGALVHPLDLFTSENTQRVVYQVSLLGPSVSPTMSYAYSTSFPDQMYAAYDELFGGVEEATGRAVVVGKWGGSLNDAQQGDAMWQKAVAEYFIDRCLDDTIYWALNPNETGGLLAGETANEGKLALMARVHPHPSLLLPNGEGWQFVSGSSANPACNA